MTLVNSSTPFILYHSHVINKPIIVIIVILEGLVEVL